MLTTSSLSLSLSICIYTYKRRVHIIWVVGPLGILLASRWGSCNQMALGVTPRREPQFHYPLQSIYSPYMPPSIYLSSSYTATISPQASLLGVPPSVSRAKAFLLLAAASTEAGSGASQERPCAAQGANIHTHIYIYKYTHSCIAICEYTYGCAYMHICICMCTYIYI